MDVIERLKESIQKLSVGGIPHYATMDASVLADLKDALSTIEAQEAEIARLREALEKIAKGVGTDLWCPDIAKRALLKGKDNG